MQPQHDLPVEASDSGVGMSIRASDDRSDEPSTETVVEILPPAFGGQRPLTTDSLRVAITRATTDWLARTSSIHTRDAYLRDLQQFVTFVGFPTDQLDRLASVRPGDVAAWRDHLQSLGNSNSTIRRKLTAIRSLFSYLNLYGYSGVNAAHGRRTVTSWIRAAGLSVQFRPSYITIAAAGKTADDIAARLAFDAVQGVADDADRLTLALDDTPPPRYGPHVQGASVHQNPTPGPTGSPWRRRSGIARRSWGRASSRSASCGRASARSTAACGRSR